MFRKYPSQVLTLLRVLFIPLTNALVLIGAVIAVLVDVFCLCSYTDEGISELAPGLYESIITDRLSSLLSSIPTDLIGLEDLDTADGDVLLAGHIASVVLRLLRLLAAITPDLDSWRPWPGYAALDQRRVSAVDGCTVADVTFVAVAVRHPSAVLSRAQRQRDAELIAVAGRAPLRADSAR